MRFTVLAFFLLLLVILLLLVGFYPRLRPSLLATTRHLRNQIVSRKEGMQNIQLPNSISLSYDLLFAQEVGLALEYMNVLNQSLKINTITRTELYYKSIKGDSWAKDEISKLMAITLPNNDWQHDSDKLCDNLHSLVERYTRHYGMICNIWNQKENNAIVNISVAEFLVAYLKSNIKNSSKISRAKEFVESVILYPSFMIRKLLDTFIMHRDWYEKDDAAFLVNCCVESLNTIWSESFAKSFVDTETGEMFINHDDLPNNLLRLDRFRLMHSLWILCGLLKLKKQRRMYFDISTQQYLDGFESFLDSKNFPKTKDDRNVVPILRILSLEKMADTLID